MLRGAAAHRPLELRPIRHAQRKLRAMAVDRINSYAEPAHLSPKPSFPIPQLLLFHLPSCTSAGGRVRTDPMLAPSFRPSPSQPS
eukprot:763042-Hanusia_phi.AAC.7